FVDALEALITPVYGISYGNLTKALSLAHPRLFPMLDSYVRRFLRGSRRDDPDWDRRDNLAFYLDRFRELMLYTGESLEQLSQPDLFLYSPVEVLDRLLWIGGWGASFYFGAAANGSPQV